MKPYTTRGAREIRICQCAPGGTVNVQGPDYGRTFGRGAEVDFAERVAPHVAVTWGQALDRYAHLFAAPGVDAPVASPQQDEVEKD